MRAEERAETGRLVGLGLRGVTGVVRDAHGAIATSVFGSVRRHLGPAARPVVTTVEIAHNTIAGGVYLATGRGLELVAAGAGLATSRRPVRDSTDPRGPGDLSDDPRARVLMAILHGFHGDKLAAHGSPVAYPMTLRRSGRDVPLSRDGVAAAYPGAVGTVVVFVHGFVGTEAMWKRRPDDDPTGRATSYGRRLEDDADVSAVWVRYNTGLRVSANGRALHDLLRALHETWPVPLERVVLVGHSMGGLVVHSALAQAAPDEPWTTVTTDTVTLGTPHHGTPLERSANTAAAMLADREATRWAADIIRYRSDGIRDLRHGNLLEQDWTGHDPEDPVDHRTLAHRHPHVGHLAVVATVARRPESRLGGLLGDLVVGRDSARGFGEAVAEGLEDERAEGAAVARTRTVLLGGLTHVALLNDERVYPFVRDVVTAPRR